LQTNTATLPGEVILLAVRWYLRYPLAYEHVSELLIERGVHLDRSRIWRWVQACAPELSKRCRPHLKPTNKSYRVDETYIKVKGQVKYLYRAVDSAGQTIDFLLTAKHDAAGAKRFFHKVFSSPANPIPRVINVDKISRHLDECGHKVRQATATITESECTCGTV
jgi:transposase, IS6 family